MKRSDSDIWEGILSGDAGAWRELVRKYQALVNTVALRAGLSMADAADCFQQTWVSLYEHRHRLQDPDRLSAWLVTTARREAIRLSQRSRRDVAAEAAGELADEGPLADEQMVQLERQAHLEAAVAQLDDRCARLVELLFFAPEDWSYERIAEKLDISFNSLGPIRQRCLNRLKKILVESGYPDVRESV
jgi:RNA polymerase sigma factor (sigma-70 family)